MANSLAFNITANDKAEKVVQAFTKRANEMTRPFQKLEHSVWGTGRFAGFSKMKENLNNITRAAMRVGSAFERINKPLTALIGGGTIAGAFALTEGWTKFGLQLSQVSQILGVNTQDMYNFQNAARLVGISGETAIQGFAQFADTLQDARWGRNQQAMGLLIGLRMKLKYTKSGAIDTMDALDQLADKIHQYQQQGNTGAARTLARQLGVTDLLPVLMQGRQALDARIAQAQKLTGSMDWNKAADAGMQWNRTDVAVSGAKNRIASKLLPVTMPVVQQFGSWISANPVLGGLAGGLMASKLLSGMYSMARLWMTKRILLGARGLSAPAAAGAETAAGETAAGGEAAAAGITGGFFEATALAGGLASAAIPGIPLGIGAAWSFDKLFPNNPLAKFGRLVGGALYDSGDNFAQTHRAQNITRFFKHLGWTTSQAAGITANIQAESNFNPRAVGDHGAARGIGQWHPDRQAKFNAWAAQNKLPSLDRAGLLEQLLFYNWELRHSDAGKRLEGAKTAADAGSIVSLYDERPAGGQLEAARRGALATQIATGTPQAAPINVSVQTTVQKDGATTTKVTTPAGVKIVHTNPADSLS